MRYSASPGYCDRKLIDAPTSTRPAEISNTVPRSLATPLYSHAVCFAVVVDMRPNSTAVRACTFAGGASCQGRHVCRDVSGTRQWIKRTDLFWPHFCL
jgi:hypothetical protein